jgi:uncharacterized protein (TIGR02594 family)
MEAPLPSRTWKEIQEALIAAGYDLGPAGADGDPGRYTREAVQKFQADSRVAIEWPGTVGAKTLAALFPGDGGTGDEGGASAPTPAPLVRAPWVQLGLTKKGLTETGAGKAKLVAFLRSDGATLGDPAKLPWCGDFVQTCIAVTVPHEPLPANPYWARNWATFGKPVEPTFGAVIVFARGNAGHVAFLVGESLDGEAWIILGGNQSNAVSVTAKAKQDTIATRWPARVDRPAIALPRMKGGKLSVNEA